MPKLMMIGLLSIALGGCASTGSSETVGAKASKSDRDCQIVKTTGGRLGKKVCSN